MGWFSKKNIDKKKTLYQYVAIRESEYFRNNLQGFIELDQYFTTAGKVYSSEDLEIMNKELNEKIEGLNLEKHFYWIEEDKYESFISGRRNRILEEQLNYTAERYYEISSVNINYDNLNRYFFESNNERESLINHLNELNELFFQKTKLSEFNMPNLMKFYGENYKYHSNTIGGIWFRILLIIKEDNYSIFKTFDNLIMITHNKEYVYKENLSDNLKNELSLCLTNISNKILLKNKDITEEEILYNSILNKYKTIDNHNVYNAIRIAFLLGKHYCNSNYDKTNKYFKIADEFLIENPKPFLSKYYKEIGECLLEIKKEKEALIWFKKGLEINPKLAVKRNIKKLEENK